MIYYYHVVLAGVWVTCLEWASFCIILLSFIFPFLPPIPLCVDVFVDLGACLYPLSVCPSPPLVNLSLQDKATPPPLLLLPPLLTPPKTHLLLPLHHHSPIPSSLFLPLPSRVSSPSPRSRPSPLPCSDLPSPHSHTSCLHPVCHTLCSAPLWEPLGVLSCQPTHQLTAPSLPLRLRLKMTSL